MRLQIASSTAKGASHRFNASRLLNMYAKPDGSTGAKASFYLEQTPGLKLFSDLNSAFPVRAGIHLSGVPYVISDETLYSVAENGAASAVSGVISGGNKISSAKIRNQAIFCADSSTHVYDNRTQALTQITDASFQKSDTVTAQNQRAVFNVRDTDQFIWSDLTDALSYDALNVATAERNDDNLVAVQANYDDLFLFGVETLEVRRPVVSNNGMSYSLIPGAVSNFGLLAKHGAVTFANGVYWLGHDKSVYGMAGYSPRSISTDAIADIIENMTSPTDCEVYAYTQKNHHFLAFSFPFDRKTLVYDLKTGLWHERGSYWNNAMQSWRCRSIFRAYGKLLCGDFKEGKVFEIDSDTYDEEGEEIRREVDFSMPGYDIEGMNFSRLEVLMDTGEGGNISNTDSDPLITLSGSIDGGATYLEIETKSSGLAGRRETRVVFHQLGNFALDASFRLSFAAKCPFRITAVDIL